MCQTHNISQKYVNSHGASFKRNKRLNACKINILQALIFKLQK